MTTARHGPLPLAASVDDTASAVVGVVVLLPLALVLVVSGIHAVRRRRAPRRVRVGGFVRLVVAAGLVAYAVNALLRLVSPT
ncbi:hypothetical protein [Rhodococcus aerolatus]